MREKQKPSLDIQSYKHPEKRQTMYCINGSVLFTLLDEISSRKKSHCRKPELFNMLTYSTRGFQTGSASNLLKISQ